MANSFVRLLCLFVPSNDVNYHNHILSLSAVSFLIFGLQDDYNEGMDDLHIESLYPAKTRFEELGKLLKYIREGSSCQLIAAPGVGRSNLCKFLCYNSAIKDLHLKTDVSRYHFVLVNFSEIKNRGTFDALKFIFLEIISSLRERDLDEEYKVCDDIFKEALSYQDELVFFEGLKRAIDYLAFKKSLNVVFLFERFETYIPQLTDDFFAHLASLRDRAKYKFSIVFSINRPLEELVEAQIMSDFYEYFAGKTVFLPILDKPGLDFRISYLEKLAGIKLSEKLRKDLIALTGGHGKLTKMCLEVILGQGKDKIDEKLLLSQKIVTKTLEEIWDFLLPSEQNFIEEVIKGRDPSILLGMTGSNMFLEQIDLVKKGKITIPLFQTFVKNMTKVEVKNDDVISYDENTNNILIGNEDISEKLTALEFRLLRFLIGNEGKLIERDQIINEVWRDNESVEGVTEQALDQLIFRLRKKIEENPNKPVHLETVKGRGVRFKK